VSTAELVVVAAIVAILGAPTIVFFASFLRSQALDGAAEQVSALLSRARHLAIAHNTTYEVEVDLPRNRLRLVRAGTGTPWTGPGTDGEGFQGLAGGARITAVTASPVFNGLGTASGGTLTVQAAEGRDALNVVVSPTGRVRRCVPAPGCP
jgi:Tfp pilus assembly protein FimT